VAGVREPGAKVPANATRSDDRDSHRADYDRVVFRLETERLIIRPWEPGDRDTFVGFTRDPEVMRYVHGGTPYAEHEIEEFLGRQARQLAEHDVCMGALVEKATSRVVGVCGIQPLGTTGDYEIGWWLARDRWGLGYATEGGAAAMRHVLSTRPRVVAIIDPANEPSKRVVERLGMTYEGRVTGAQLGYRHPDIVVDLFAATRDGADRA
jgi:RimJ/RimL family protein N-acetyltransferase